MSDFAKAVEDQWLDPPDDPDDDLWNLVGRWATQNGVDFSEWYGQIEEDEGIEQLLDAVLNKRVAALEADADAVRAEADALAKRLKMNSRTLHRSQEHADDFDECSYWMACKEANALLHAHDALRSTAAQPEPEAEVVAYTCPKCKSVWTAEDLDGTDGMCLNVDNCDWEKTLIPATPPEPEAETLAYDVAEAKADANSL